jgi:hypothetical protein
MIKKDIKSRKSKINPESFSEREIGDLLWGKIDIDLISEDTEFNKLLTLIQTNNPYINTTMKMIMKFVSIYKLTQ